MKTNTFEFLESLCRAKGIVCERRGKKVFLTTPCGGTEAECEGVRDAFDTFRGDPTFSELPLKFKRSATGEHLPPPPAADAWKRRPTSSVECRKTDLVIRVTDWTKDKDEPAYDVEVYLAGVYDYDLSKTITTRSGNRSNAQARTEAIQFAQMQIQNLLP